MHHNFIYIDIHDIDSGVHGFFSVGIRAIPGFSNYPPTISFNRYVSHIDRLT